MGRPSIMWGKVFQTVSCQKAHLFQSGHYLLWNRDGHRVANHLYQFSIFVLATNEQHRVPLPGQDEPSAKARDLVRITCT